MSAIAEGVRRVDAYQRRHPFLAFPVAVMKKFGDDRAGQLAALIAYYGFFSLFPLLLVFVTILGFVLRANPAAQAKILSSTLANFPILGDQIRGNIGSLDGSGLAAAAGLTGALWAGLGGVRAFQNAMNDVWNVPRERRPNVVRAVMRSLVMLVVVGTGAVAGAVAGAIGGGNAGLRLIGVVATLTVNFALFSFAFRILTVADVSWRDVMPGAAVAAAGWAALHAIGGWYLGNRLQGATEVYGFFAVVLGLLVWITLGAQLTLVAAEVNVVRVRRMWPRSLAEGKPNEPAQKSREEPPVLRKTG